MLSACWARIAAWAGEPLASALPAWLDIFDERAGAGSGASCVAVCPRTTLGTSPRTPITNQPTLMTHLIGSVGLAGAATHGCCQARVRWLTREPSGADGRDLLGDEPGPLAELLQAQPED